MSSNDDKKSVDVHDTPQLSDSDNVDEKKGTAADRLDMYRMGKTQDLTVRAIIRALYHR